MITVDFYSIFKLEYTNMNKSHNEKAAILKALGHPVRFCIVEGLLAGERNVASMVDCTGVPQPTVSQHLNILKAAEIIEGCREGNQIRYSVCNERARAVILSMR
jgi:DNA-binding transcriptional ArsR family regulator